MKQKTTTYIRASNAAKDTGIPKATLIRAIKDGLIRGGQAGAGPTSPFMIHAEDLEKYVRDIGLKGRQMSAT